MADADIDNSWLTDMERPGHLLRSGVRRLLDRRSHRRRTRWDTSRCQRCRRAPAARLPGNGRRANFGRRAPHRCGRRSLRAPRPPHCSGSALSSATAYQRRSTRHRASRARRSGRHHGARPPRGLGALHEGRGAYSAQEGRPRLVKSRAGDGIRTRDIRDGSPALYQLSYSRMRPPSRPDPVAVRA